ncbi:hypothetical protein ABRT01_06505 [Lentibacillus sp. L22]|uniref:hypothetical protein n=1 Tax=Lentibacillus sp. L22 TaxID=3163028 RepID=UPI0034660C5F
MVRAVITLLLLAVFFLSGMLYGIDHGQEAKTVQQEEQVQEQDSSKADVNKQEVETIEVNNEPEPEMDTSAHLTQKTASFLGDIIKGIYEMVVMIFYQFAQVFF